MKPKTNTTTKNIKKLTKELKKNIKQDDVFIKEFTKEQNNFYKSLAEQNKQTEILEGLFVFLGFFFLFGSFYLLFENLKTSAGLTLLLFAILWFYELKKA